MGLIWHVPAAVRFRVLADPFCDAALLMCDAWFASTTYESFVVQE
jgi:hypothetical protein